MSLKEDYTKVQENLVGSNNVLAFDRIWHRLLELEHEQGGRRPEVILGQEAICPYGLGRVVAYKFKEPDNFIRISTYRDNEERSWSPEKVELIDPRR